jgi:tetratricopeptide (TPR) repeat protein
MKRGKLNLLFTIVALLACFGAVYGLTNFIEQNKVTMPEEYNDIDLSLEGKRLKGFALGAEGLLADWYWMRSLQYIGDKLAKTELEYINVEDLSILKPRLLYPLLDNATDLDPKMMAAYTYGAMVLPAIDPRQAVALTEKAIATNPDSWRMYQYLGYIHWRLKDYEKAAAVYEEGSKIAGAPPFMRLMAASMKTRGGSRDLARAMYQQMYEDSQDQQTKGNAEFRLNEIDSLNERDAMNAALKKSMETSGRCPASLREILPQLRNVKLPAGRVFQLNANGDLVDPTGVPYLLERNTCEAKIDAVNSKIPPTTN